MTHNPRSTVAPVGRDEFEALVRSRMREPFGWGVHDCCLFAADAVKALTGVDPAAGFRGTYSTAAEAVDVLARIGGIEAAAARVGSEIRPLFARQGDVGLLEDGKRLMLGVCAGAMWLVPMAMGLGVRPLAVATKAWRVACPKE